MTTTTALRLDQKGFGIHTMNTGDGDVELLSRAILSEAQAEADELKAEARSKADAARQRAQAEADRERSEILGKAQIEAERLRSPAIATAQLKARSTELQHREQLLDKAFEAARRKIDSIADRQDYEEVVLGLVREGIAQLKSSDVQVCADAHAAKMLTATVLTSLESEQHVHLSLGPSLEDEVGVVLQTQAGHLRYDNTLQTRLARLQSTLRAAVYAILMGEAK